MTAAVPTSLRLPDRLWVRRACLGFTLIELIVVIAISGIIAASIAVFLLGPIRGYDAQVRRAELVDAAESALRRMQRDIRGALPNSIRVDGTGRIIEMLSTVDGGRYRASPGVNPVLPTDPDPLLFNGADTQFDVMGALQNFAAILPANNYWVVINNQTASDTATAFNAYSGSGHNRVQLVLAGSTAQHIVLGGSFPGDAPGAPSARSEGQRFFIVDAPVTYRCDTGARTLTRYAGYAITAVQPTDSSVAPLSTAPSIGRVAAQVANCVFTYQAGTSQRAGVVTLDLTVNDTTVNEQVRLLHQTHVYNVP